MKTHLVIISALVFALAAAARSDEVKPAPAPAPSAVTGTAPALSVSPAPKGSQAPQSKPVENYEFMGTKWGMSKAQVKAIEHKKPKKETDNSLTFSGRYKKRLVYITYQFKDDKLFRAGTIHVEKLDNDAMYLQTYEDVKKEVTDAYGPPVIDGEKQLNPKAVINPDKKAEAVCRGDLTYGAQWNIPGSVVFLSIRGENKKCLITLIYTSEEAFKSLTGQTEPANPGRIK